MAFPQSQGPATKLSHRAGSLQLKGMAFSFSELPRESTDIYGLADNKLSHPAFAFRTKPGVMASIRPLVPFRDGSFLQASCQSPAGCNSIVTA